MKQLLLLCAAAAMPAAIALAADAPQPGIGKILDGQNPVDRARSGPAG